MESYLQIENLTKSVNDRLLFQELTFGIYKGDKIGLIAPNGAGKTTFLNILANETDYDEGNVVYRNDLKIGYLRQSPDFNVGETVLEYIRRGEEGKMHHEDGLPKIHAILDKLNIKDLDAPVNILSGGQRKRLALAKVLISEPDFLILDEPTNHLDIAMVEWLEDYLSKNRVTLLLVTHDRYFLDNVCNKILEIDREYFYVYEGNYNYYLRKREERIQSQNAELLRVKNILRKELDWMRRQPQARGTKSRSRKERFYELQDKSRQGRIEKNVNLLKSKTYIGSKIFEARNVSKSFGNKRIVKDWSYNFARFDKVGIVGDNGIGKTTFIRMLLGEIQADSGTIDVGSTVKWGYFSQDGLPKYDSGKRVIDIITDIAEDVKIDGNSRLSASQFLTRFLFPPKRQQDSIEKLSGGELRRLHLATVLIKNPNFLILDEPTNDLDIITLSVLEDYLEEFKGCVIVISHDRYFLDRITEHLFVFEGDGKIADYPGSYSDYRLTMKEKERLDKEIKNSNSDKDSQQIKKVKTQKIKLSFKQKRELEESEKALEQLSAEKSQIEKELSSGQLNHTEIAEKSKRFNELTELIDELEMRILELMDIEEN